MTHPDEAAMNPRAGRAWPLIVVALLLGQVVLSGVTVLYAVSDPAFATEPDYYRKALSWDSDASRRRAAHELGWEIHLDVSTIESPLHNRNVRVLLRDRDGGPLRGADMTCEAFPHARAKDRLTLSFREIDGAYEAELPVRRIGIWELRLTLRHGDRSASITKIVDIGPAEGKRP